MQYDYPALGRRLDSVWLAPLYAVARAVLLHPDAHLFDADDFMIMARVLRRTRPSLVLYKHVHTRRYLNLDDAGHAYRYVGPISLTSRYRGRYVAHSNLRTAIDHLELWQLPWMKRGLERLRNDQPFPGWEDHPPR